MEEGFLNTKQKEWLDCFANNELYAATDDQMSVANEHLAEVLICKYDYLDTCISNEHFDSSLNSNLVLLLKFILENGEYLDRMANYREQVDMFFTLFRNLLRNHLKCLPDSINLLILRLIEIRASKWRVKSCIEEYYIKKIAKSSRQGPSLGSNPTLQYCIGHEPKSTSTCSVGLRTTKSYSDINSKCTLDDAMFGRHKQLKSNNKAVLKKEVVIRNCDSGKVMGIKGRRVHMIEEISDTIISFQKVSPTAKDRIVQISGPTSASINIAKNLIDATIKQNVSPIPFQELFDNSDTNIANVEDNGVTCESVQAKYSSQSSATSVNSECEQSSSTGHHIKLNIDHNDIDIIVQNKFIGELLEQFLHQHNFISFFEKFEPSCLKLDATSGSKPKPQKSSNQTQAKHTYDRDFLLSFKETNQNETSHVSEDIKKNALELYRH